MASDKATLAYRPDEDEKQMLDALKRKMGMSFSRLIGLAIREMAERKGVQVEGGTNETVNTANRT